MKPKHEPKLVKNEMSFDDEKSIKHEVKPQNESKSKESISSTVKESPAEAL